MILTAAVMASCAVPLAIGRHRRSPRAWATLVVMVGGMAYAAIVDTAGAHLIGGIVTLAVAPIAVAGIGRAEATAALHRASAALLMAWFLFAGSGADHTGSASPSSSHHALSIVVLLVAMYALLVLATLRDELRATRTRRWRLCGLGEVGITAAGVVAMAFG